MVLEDGELIARYEMALEAIKIALLRGAAGAALNIATKALEDHAD